MTAIQHRIVLSRVRRGVRFLDKLIPRWRCLIKLDDLNLAFCNTCILGQMFGDYDDGVVGLTGVNKKLAVQYGLIAPKTFRWGSTAQGEYYRELTQAWQRELRWDDV